MSALILFDFDGTLADTAPDLAAAANRQRTRKGLEPMAYEALRPVASQGARGLLRVALGLAPGDRDYEPTRLQFLEDYAAGSTVHSKLFPGIEALLADIGRRGLSWGIVTNKVTYLTLPIVEFLDLTRDSAVLVCGDTTAHSKPHPLPLQHAASEAGFSVDRCVYVGDDLRDIQAAHAAGMPAVAAAYGYVGEDDNITTWEAETCANSPAELWPAIEPLLPRDLR
ncbi:HAD-IA family hydrolase [Achromobacter veterisilvae]|jgi:2-phosphoglycolate phosphatase|uniref:HAD-IA family hydrolase n=1 Tax=Achromobacter veterisilvae TaxID=2069367 RepID=A0A446CU22_9BURK|nr:MULTISPECIES: HAD-IA family hydrolase [Achromobacter]MCW0207623.1 HAD-IA family hydrolase [Achromobacter sp.]SSW71366.1 Phosphoglycolate phosphatase, chromosomal [Achromobacter veterisilvae]